MVGVLSLLTKAADPVSPEEQGLQTKAATQKELSDMDYLKSKMVRRAEVSSEDEDSEDEAVNCEASSEAEEEEGGSPASPVPQKSTSGAAAADKVGIQL